MYFSAAMPPASHACACSASRASRRGAGGGSGRAVRPDGVRRAGCAPSRLRRLHQRGVVHQAAGEGMGQPVDMEAFADLFGQVVQRRVRQISAMPSAALCSSISVVLRQEITAFFAALPQQLGVALAAGSPAACRSRRRAGSGTGGPAFRRRGSGVDSYVHVNRWPQ